MVALALCSLTAGADDPKPSLSPYQKLQLCRREFLAAFRWDYADFSKLTLHHLRTAFDAACAAEILEAHAATPPGAGSIEVDDRSLVPQVPSGWPLPPIRFPHPGERLEYKNMVLLGAESPFALAPDERAIGVARGISWIDVSYVGRLDGVPYAYGVEEREPLPVFSGFEGAVGIDESIAPVRYAPAGEVTVVCQHGDDGLLECFFDTRQFAEVSRSAGRIVRRYEAGLARACLTLESVGGREQCVADANGSIVTEWLKRESSSLSDATAAAAIALADHLVRLAETGDAIPRSDTVRAAFQTLAGFDEIDARNRFELNGQTYVECLMLGARRATDGDVDATVRLVASDPYCGELSRMWIEGAEADEVDFRDRAVSEALKLLRAGRTFAEPDWTKFDISGATERDAVVDGHAGRASDFGEGYAYAVFGAEALGVLPVLASIGARDIPPVVVRCERRHLTSCVASFPLVASSEWIGHGQTLPRGAMIARAPHPSDGTSFLLCLEQAGTPLRGMDMRFPASSQDPWTLATSGEDGCFTAPGILSLNGLDYLPMRMFVETGSAGPLLYPIDSDDNLVADSTVYDRTANFIRFLAAKLETAPELDTP